MSLDNMAVSPSGALWAACSGQGSGQERPRTLSVSDDRGASWGRVWSGSAYGSFPVGIAAFSATTAAMGIQLYLSVTTDGGFVWSQTQAGYDPGGPSMFDILSLANIWYFVPGEGGGGVRDPVASFGSATMALTSRRSLSPVLGPEPTRRVTPSRCMGALSPLGSGTFSVARYPHTTHRGTR